MTDVHRPWWKQFGPGLLVTAAFIGPGTVTTASRAGAQFGYALLWALLFAVVATIILQEMAARLGLIARRGLGDAMRESIAQPLWRWLALALVLAAIALGNTAYQTGNITGAALGLSLLTGWSGPVGAGIIGTMVTVLLLLGSASSRLQTVLIAMVLLMSAAFLATAIYVQPNWSEAFSAMSRFVVPEHALLTVVALIGTTVVPYNLFLHATTVQQKWSAEVDTNTALREARWDTALAIVLGGLVTMSIVATAAATFFQQGIKLDSAGQMAEQLEPLLGSVGKTLFALGMLAAGVTSAITAPLAAGYAVAGAFEWKKYSSSQIASGMAIGVALVGTVLAVVFGKSPQATIIVAQAANGVLLPMVALFLLLVMNRQSLLGEHRNGTLANVLGSAVVLVSLGLGAVMIGKLFG